MLMCSSPTGLAFGGPVTYKTYQILISNFPFSQNYAHVIV